MDSQADPDPSAGPPQSLVVERHRVRRPLGKAFWGASVLAVAGLVGLTTLMAATAVEDALDDAASAHLADVGLKNVGLRVDGLNVDAAVPAGRDVHEVEDELLTVPGVGMVTAVEVYRSKAEERACAQLQRDLAQATAKQRIPFEGTTARLAPAGVQMLHRVADLLKGCPGAVVIVGGHSDAHTNDFSTLSLVRARVMTAQLKRDGVPSARLVPRGYGDEFPIADGNTPAAQQRNQRGSVVEQGTD